MDHSPR